MPDETSFVQKGKKENCQGIEAFFGACGRVKCKKWAKEVRKKKWSEAPDHETEQSTLQMPRRRLKLKPGAR